MTERDFSFHLTWTLISVVLAIALSTLSDIRDLLARKPTVIQVMVPFVVPIAPQCPAIEFNTYRPGEAAP